MVILRYYQKVKEKYQGQKLIQEVKEKILLVDKDGILCRSHELYFHSHNLELYLSGVNDIHYIDLDIYKDATKEFGIETVRMFLLMLGVKLYPKIESFMRWDKSYLSERLKSQILITNIYDYRFEDYALQGFNEFKNIKYIKKHLIIYGM